MPAPRVAVISAAGLGSRLGMDMPKCLVSVLGVTVVERMLALLHDIPDVRVVVGFLEDRVVEHVRSLRDDVIFVRNPDYARTTTLQSIWRAVRHLQEPFLAIDGDLLLEEQSFRRFLARCAETEGALLGLSPAGTEEAVYVRAEPDPDGGLKVVGFQRQGRTELEWTGLALLTPELIEDEPRALFECLVPHLPLAGAVLGSLEVDTPADLERATRALIEGHWPAWAGDRPA